MPNPSTVYLKQVQKHLSLGDATEHTYRPAFQDLIEALVPESTATNEPKRIACGAPDFIVTKGQVPIGHIEAKDVGKNLDAVEDSDQLKRYRESLPNLILTDYLEFRLYHDGEMVMEARLARAGRDGKLTKDKDGPAALTELFDAFANATIPTVGTPHDLADRMAAIARLLRSTIKKALEGEDQEQGPLHQQMSAFRQVLLNDLEEDQFADMYAQTICYGMFAARCQHGSSKGPFTRMAAGYEIPQTNPFLREMFDYIAGTRLDDRLTWAVDHLAELLARADMHSILENFGRRTRQEDPVVHFYETFLAAYDPALREMRGVYYTPEPVVSYIVRSVDHILKQDFGLPDGLASTDKITMALDDDKTQDIHKVLILDPAAGTGTFLHGVVDQIHQTVVQDKDMAGGWDSYVSEHLLPRLFGFELLMAPYAVCHLKLAIQLAEYGYSFQSGERLRVYLTNTLQEAGYLEERHHFAGAIAKEAESANDVKTQAPVMVVLGNPPYSGESANDSQWIADLMRGMDKGRDETLKKTTENYFMVDGGPLGERNPKWINNDYVKFMRFAQWRIDRTGYGILAFISDHGYLQNATFRGMRQSLMNTFDDVYLLDLHGGSLKKEASQHDSKDENVFDIQQGVAIGIFVKRRKGKSRSAARIHHAELWGPREIWQESEGGEKTLSGGKYLALYESDVSNTQWKEVKPQSPYYIFVPKDMSLWDEYENGWKITEAIPINSVGIATARDKLTIGWDKDVAWRRVTDFCSVSEEDAREKYNLGRDAQDWQVALAQEDVKSSGPNKGLLASILYRPFDQRWTYYTGKSRGYICRPRTDVMRHVRADKNIALSTTRSIEIGRGWEHAFCSSGPIDHHAVSSKEANYLFPLYLYPKPEQEAENLLDIADAVKAAESGTGRVPNLAAELIEDFSARLKLKWVIDGQGDTKKTFGPEDVFHYIYAVFHAPTYRERYGEYLKMDFPRIPLTSKEKLFRKLCALGQRLKDLHLMEGQVNTFATFPEKGDNKVAKLRYDAEHQRVYINQDQYFGDVPPRVWEFHVGGYQVCHKWLKDRKGRKLSYDDISTYQFIVAALDETIDLMEQIDQAINQNGGWPIQ